MVSEELDPIWRALSSPLRRRILDLLRDRPCTTGELAEQFPDLSRFAVMQHLGVLEAAGLILVRREGRKRFNYLNPVPLRQIYERWVGEHASRAAEATLRLKEFVEQPKVEEGPMELQAGKVLKIETEVRFAAPPERVFAALTAEMNEWWPFRFRPEGKVVCEPWVGGRIFEDWGEGQGALYGQILHFEPPFKLGSRGPGAMSGAYTSVDWGVIEADGDGSIYRQSMMLWGDLLEETVKMLSEGVKTIIEDRLRAYLEEGKRYEA